MGPLWGSQIRVCCLRLPLKACPFLAMFSTDTNRSISEQPADDMEKEKKKRRSTARHMISARVEDRKAGTYPIRRQPGVIAHPPPTLRPTSHESSRSTSLHMCAAPDSICKIRRPQETRAPSGCSNSRPWRDENQERPLSNRSQPFARCWALLSTCTACRMRCCWFWRWSTRAGAM